MSGGSRSRGGTVLVSPRGTPRVEIRLSRNLAQKAAGFPQREGLTPRARRHSFATRFLGIGGPVTDPKQQRGHAELATTRIYASSLSAGCRAAVMALNFTSLRRL